MSLPRPEASGGCRTRTIIGRSPRSAGCIRAAVQVSGYSLSAAQPIPDGRTSARDWASSMSSTCRIAMDPLTASRAETRPLPADPGIKGSIAAESPRLTCPHPASRARNRGSSEDGPQMIHQSLLGMGVTSVI